MASKLPSGQSKPAANTENEENPDNRNSKQNKVSPSIIVFLQTWGDLIAQMVMAIGTLAIVAFTGWGLHFIRKTYEASKRTLLHSGRAANAAKRQIDEARRIGESQTRAYLRITDAALSISEKEECFALTLSCHNSGNSPASKILISVKFVPFGNITPQPSPIWVIARLGDIAAKSIETMQPVSLSDAKVPKETWGNNFEKMIGVMVELAVFAEDVFGKEITTFSRPIFMWESEARTKFISGYKAEAFMPPIFSETGLSEHRRKAQSERDAFG